MKILIISRFGDSYGLAYNMARKGHKIYFYIMDNHYKNIGKDIKEVERIRFYEPYVDRADYIIFDMSGIGKKADFLKNKKPVIGGSAVADKMERDRSFAQDLMKKYAKNVKIPKYKEFHSVQDGIRFLENEEAVYVFKPDNMPTNWTFVPRKDNASVISVMKLCPKKNQPFILQEKIEDAIEISTEGWWNGKEWIKGMFNHTMEQKRFLNGDWGPNCGCTGSMVWKCGEDKLVKELLLPLTPFIKSSGYVGPFDVNALVNEDEAYFLEFSPRFGYDAVQNLSLLMPNFGKDLYNIAKGGGTDIELEDGYSMSVRLSMAPYPASEDTSKLARPALGMKVVDIPEELKDYVMLVDVMKKDDELVMAGVDNIIGTVHAVSDDIDDCRELLYGKEGGLIEAVVITSDVQMRTDIGKGMSQELGELKGMGWID